MSPSLNDERRLIAETPIDRTLSRIEAAKNMYWDSKVALFGFAYAQHTLSREEQVSYVESLKSTLYYARWLMELVSSKVIPDDRVVHERIYNELTNYDISRGAGEELFILLRNFDRFSSEYLDKWKHESVGLLMIAASRKKG